MPEPTRSRRGLRVRSLVPALIATLVIASSCTSEPLTSPGNEPLLPADAVLLFYDDFDEGALNDDVWNTCHWWSIDGGCTIATNDELQWYQPDNVSVADGVLRLEARIEETVATDGKVFAYTSGMVTTGPPNSTAPAKFDFRYGVAEARVRVPAGGEFWPAFWLLPASTESRPEIDIMEMHGNEPTTNGIHLHSFDESGRRQSFDDSFDGDDFTAGWHNFGVAWGPGGLTWLLDGRPIRSLAADNDLGMPLPDESLYVVLNLAIDPDAEPPLAGAAGFPAALEVDWVQVWHVPSGSP